MRDIYLGVPLYHWYAKAFGYICGKGEGYNYKIQWFNDHDDKTFEHHITTIDLMMRDLETYLQEQEDDA
jgi:hypothetical protein